MSYALRNTVILVVLWLLVVLTGVLYERYSAREIRRLTQRERQLRARAEEVSDYLGLYDDVRSTLDRLHWRWQNRPRALMPEDSPAQTFSYLNDILDMPEAFVKFDFSFLGSEKGTAYSHNSYKLAGEGDFRNLTNFIWYIEHGQPFYAISELDIRLDPAVSGTEGEFDWDRVKFAMTLLAYFNPEVRIQEGLRVQDLVAPMPGYNPFKPLVLEMVPPNSEGLFDLTGARLRGVGYREAFLEDKGGTLHVLREGDRVYLGVLDRVDQASNHVVFLLDRAGIPERIVLEVPLKEEGQ